MLFRQKDKTTWIFLVLLIVIATVWVRSLLFIEDLNSPFRRYNPFCEDCPPPIYEDYATRISWALAIPCALYAGAIAIGMRRVGRGDSRDAKNNNDLVKYLSLRERTLTALAWCLYFSLLPYLIYSPRTDYCVIQGWPRLFASEFGRFLAVSASVGSGVLIWRLYKSHLSISQRWERVALILISTSFLVIWAYHACDIMVH